MNTCENNRLRRTRVVRIAGFTLIELMTALAVGSFLVIGATTIYLQGRRSFSDNEAISRLHEDARYALAAIEPDIRMASFYGQQARADLIQGSAGPLDPIDGAFVTAPSCGDNWAVDLAQPVAGTNNGYAWACAPTIGAARAGADTLVIRRAAEDPETGALDPNTIYLHSTRTLLNALFRGSAGVPFTTVLGTETTHELVTHGYYISTQSDNDTTVPSLRRWRLASGPSLMDEEILSGVEDMQIELGVDTDPLGIATRGSVNQYVAADAAILDPADPAFNPDAQVLAVRIWLLVRAQNREPGFTDNVYAYSDRDWGAVIAPTDVRRLLVSKTIYLRNVRTANND
jgi:prepilin-type N-terminal cleavage/methylation domain-containing protein